jgi:hypothetical protein
LRPRVRLENYEANFLLAKRLPACVRTHRRADIGDRQRVIRKNVMHLAGQTKPYFRLQTFHGPRNRMLQACNHAVV